MHNHVLDYLYRIEDKKPDKTAYTDGTAGLTFKEVANVTRSVGSFLAGKGIYRKPVVVFMQKSAMEIASFFGVIAGGCYYVPLDEEMPGDRIRLILEKVNSPVMICDETTIEKANELKTECQEVVLYSEVSNGEVHRYRSDLYCIYIRIHGDSERCCGMSPFGYRLRGAAIRGAWI